MTWIITGIIFLFVIIILVTKSFTTIDVNEMAVILTLGAPRRKAESGLHLIFWPFQKAIRIPTTQQIINFVVQTIITKKGKLDGYDKIIESAEINLPFTLGYYFDFNYIIELVKNAPGFSEKEMSDVLVPYLDDVIRTIIGKMPYRLINEEGRKITQIILSRCVPFSPIEKNYKLIEKKCNEVFTFSLEENQEKLSADELSNSPFVKFGLMNITLSSSNVDFSDDDLQKIISDVEKSSIKASAKRIDAEVDAYKIEKIGDAEAKSRNAMIQIIKAEKDLEVLLTLRELAKGTSNTILYQLPRALETKVTELLGNNSPGETIKLFSDENKKFIANTIEETIKQLKTSSGGKI